MEKETFTLTKDHLILLKSMYVRWEFGEHGAPCIDTKRPYGNSNVEGDIADALGWELFEDSDGDLLLSKEQAILADRLHRETKTALQICLSTQSFQEGVYETTRPYDSTSWRLIK